jgi:hypothetical protein
VEQLVRDDEPCEVDHACVELDRDRADPVALLASPFDHLPRRDERLSHGDVDARVEARGRHARAIVDVREVAAERPGVLREVEQAVALRRRRSRGDVHGAVDMEDERSHARRAVAAHLGGEPVSELARAFVEAARGRLVDGPLPQDDDRDVQRSRPVVPRVAAETSCHA